MWSVVRSVGCRFACGSERFVHVPLWRCIALLSWTFAAAKPTPVQCIGPTVGIRKEDLVD
jgi:hypothetical protein